MFYKNVSEGANFIWDNCDKGQCIFHSYHLKDRICKYSRYYYLPRKIYFPSMGTIFSINSNKIYIYC